MLALLKIHRKNRKTGLDLKHKFLAKKISEHNYGQLCNLVENERFFIEESLYEYIEKEEAVNHHFRTIAGMITVLYGIALAAFIHNWIVN